MGDHNKNVLTAAGHIADAISEVVKQPLHINLLERMDRRILLIISSSLEELLIIEDGNLLKISKLSTQNKEEILGALTKMIEATNLPEKTFKKY